MRPRVATTSRERGTLLDTESVLLIHHDQAEVVELNSLLEKRVSAHDDARLPRRDGSQLLPPLAG